MAQSIILNMPVIGKMELHKTGLGELWSNLLLLHPSRVEKHLHHTIFFFCKLLKKRQHPAEPLLVHMAAVEHSAEISCRKPSLLKLSLKADGKAVKDNALKHI